VNRHGAFGHEQVAGLAEGDGPGDGIVANARHHALLGEGTADGGIVDGLAALGRGDGEEGGHLVRRHADFGHRIHCLGHGQGGHRPGGLEIVSQHAEGGGVAAQLAVAQFRQVIFQPVYVHRGRHGTALRRVARHQGTAFLVEGETESLHVHYPEPPFRRECLPHSSPSTGAVNIAVV